MSARRILRDWDFFRNGPMPQHLGPRCKSEAASSGLLAIGPEGGWTDAEVARSLMRRFPQASLGRLILRTETAVIACTCVVVIRFGQSVERAAVRATGAVT